MFAQDDKLIENLLSSLKECFLCTGEGLSDGFLGVEIKSQDGQLTLKEPQLIKWTTELLKLQDSNPGLTPVAKTLLSKSNNGKDRILDFHCRLAIGCLSCLAGCTLP